MTSHGKKQTRDIHDHLLDCAVAPAVTQLDLFHGHSPLRSVTIPPIDCYHHFQAILMRELQHQPELGLAYYIQKAVRDCTLLLSQLEPFQSLQDAFLPLEA